MSCPLCGEDKLTIYFQDKFRSYELCSQCELISVPRDQILPPQDEFQRYESHNNDENDPRYRAYLTKTADAIRERVSSGAQGLDFGCGSSLLMAKIFGEYQMPVDSFDIYFHPSPEIWRKSYDFIVMGEVIEHLREPLEELLRLRVLLKPGGKIFVKTKLYPADLKDFPNWYYKNDPTHVQFFSQRAFSRLAELTGLKGPVELPAPDLFEFSS